MPTPALRRQRILGYRKPHLLRLQGQDLGLISDDTKSLWYWVAVFQGFAAYADHPRKAQQLAMDAYWKFVVGAEATDSLLDLFERKTPHVRTH